MDLPSLSAGPVGSRFVSQEDLETAKARRDEQWKAAYARLGQEPPPQQQHEDSYDGRSLAEIAKQEEWEEETKLGMYRARCSLSTSILNAAPANQFRALEEDEIMFLDSVRERQEAEERQRKEKDGEEVKGFKEAVAARTSAVNNPPPLLAASTSTAPPKPSKATPSVRKDAKRSLKGVVVKKKLKVPISPKPTAAVTTPAIAKDETEPPNPKRQKTIDS
ncbi:hypothetical protein H0H81_003804 [Sphagnurus paluster]|uniref:FAM192A/Fyv6 N-terminal domain-containing protein n=1 Tax=Sphagnurus paluster TaxID=117069 RepID=A0A9P7KPU0_9AGAR|nr:hypothetical protein H0H81_003804 [Sphagnurus paluster]